MLPFLTLVAMAAVLMGMLNALGHFFLPALSPAMFNVATIIMALALVPVAPALGIDPIMIVAVSTIVGGVGQLLLQWSPARAEGFRYEPRLDVRDEGLRQVLLLMVPGTIGLAATQINVFVNTILATGQGTGAVTWLDLAFRLMYLPIGLFGVSIAAATTPAVSRLVASTDREQLKTTVASGLALMLVLSVPATLGLIVLAEPIVALVFEYGNFTAADTRATAAALQFYALGLVGYSMVRIVSPTFYALQRSRVPVAASAASVAVNIGLNLVLVRVMGYRGLALGASAAAIVNGALQLWQLRRRLQGIHGRRIAVTFAQMLMASLAMAATAWATERWMESLVPGDGLPARLSRVATAIGAGVAVLGVAAHLLRVREFDEVRRTIWRRMGGRDS
jgi:putative peptidoglycan lipid II flippase